MFLAYAVTSTICYSVMVRLHNSFKRLHKTDLKLFIIKVCLGEMIAYLPIPGGHIKLAERFVDPALSFTMGWNYWYSWTILLPTEMSAAAVLMSFWKSVSIIVQ